MARLEHALKVFRREFGDAEILQIKMNESDETVPIQIVAEIEMEDEYERT